MKGKKNSGKKKSSASTKNIPGYWCCLSVPNRGPTILFFSKFTFEYYRRHHRHRHRHRRLHHSMCIYFFHYNSFIQCLSLILNFFKWKFPAAAAAASKRLNQGIFFLCWKSNGLNNQIKIILRNIMEPNEYRHTHTHTPT